ncbi:MAG: LysR family transcriptional regulator [Alphaproteobacteria bacterium]
MNAPGFSGQLADIDIRLLKVFVGVVEAGGFTPAEAQLGIARSTISTHIANLEARLGLTLCRRGRGGFALSQEGQLVYREALTLIDALNAFGERVSGVGNRLTGNLNLAVIDGIMTLPQVKVSEALSRFRALAPDVHIKLSVLSSQDMERRLLDGSLHVAILGLHRKKAGLAYREIAREIQYVYCGRGHPLFEKKQISSSDLTAHDYVGLSHEDLPHATERPYQTRPAASAGNLEGVLLLLQTGRFLGRLPTQFADGLVENGTLRPLRPDLTRYEQSFAVATPVSVQVPAVLAAFLDCFERENAGRD